MKVSLCYSILNPPGSPATNCVSTFWNLSPWQHTCSSKAGAEQLHLDNVPVVSERQHGHTGPIIGSRLTNCDLLLYNHTLTLGNCTKAPARMDQMPSLAALLGSCTVWQWKHTVYPTTSVRINKAPKLTNSLTSNDLTDNCGHITYRSSSYPTPQLVQGFCLCLNALLIK